MDLRFVTMTIFVMTLQICFKGISCDKKGQETCPGDNWAQLDNTCYYYMSTGRKWDDAQSDCESRGGTQLIFESPSERANVFKQIRQVAKEIDTIPTFWLGAHNQYGDGIFRWADGSDVSHPPWKEKLEAATGGNCVALMSDKSKGDRQWGLMDCSEEIPYVCELQLGGARWTGWGVWSTCTVSCGAGSRERTRTCLRPTDTSGHCDGDATDTEKCSNKCPEWDKWGKWSDCSVTCDTGSRTRSRSCSVSGQCQGEATEREECKEEICEVWANWAEWSVCSVSCGQGQRSRSRSCTSGDICKGEKEEKEKCRMDACPEWRNWEKWSDCSVTCGKGSRSRTRSCSVSGQCKGERTASEGCLENDCEIWTNWNSWSPCSVTCGSGQRSRSRECTSKGCKGDKEMKERCKMADCPVWERWGSWGDCSVTCGMGITTRSRSCSSEVKDACQGNAKEDKKCSMPKCNDKASWSKWGLWGECSVTCGLGRRTRRRECVDGYGETATTCKGDNSKNKGCLSPCKDVSQVEKLLKTASPTEVKQLNRILKKLSNKQLKEDVFNAEDTDDWILEGYELQEVSVDRPLTCARICIQFEICHSFNYEDKRDENGLNDLKESKRCILNSISKDEDRSALRRRTGFRLFDLEPFFM